ncbi:MAG: efflux RND transporter permease subunit [Mariniblastus sp.]|nr:efflux RND transporter permease subunit [Mariniblastus sp.]
MIQAALKNPYLVVVFSLAIAVLGGFSYTKIPADLLPQFNTSAVQIVCFYPGMPPEVMEKDIMSRLQRWTGQSVGIEHQEAKAMQSVCVVKDFFREGISMDTAMAQVTSFAMSDMYYLPPGTIPPMVMPFDPTAAVPLCLVVVSNDQMNESELYDIAYYELRNKLQSIQGVIAPAVYGGKLRRILAYVDPMRLEAHGVSLMDVQRALMQQNVLIPAGSIKDGDQELQIFTNANVDRVEMLNDIPIKRANGQFVYMRDVANVENTHQIQSNIVRVNSSRKAYIPIYRQPGANTISIVKQIKKQLKTIEERLKIERSEDPKMKSLVLSVAMDQSVGVEEGNRSLQIAAGLGALLAGLVVFLFLRSLKFTFIIVVAIPIAILFSVLVMYLLNSFGISSSINAMTLGGLALAIGILIDQSIVVLENVTRHSRMGKNPYQASLDGTREVAIPMLVATLTFAFVFLPVIFLTGMAKLLFQPIAISAVMAIFASYFLAITLIPAYLSRFMSQKEAEKEPKPGVLTRIYGAFLPAMISMRFLVVLGSLLGFGVAVWYLTTQMGRELFPQVDSGQITMYVRMPTGTRIEKTEAKVIAIEKEVIKLTGEPDPGFAVGAEEKPDSDLQLLVSNIGVLLDWPAAYTPNAGAMDAFMLIQTKGKKQGIFEYVQQLRSILHEKFPDVEFAFDTGGMLTAALNMGEPSPIHFQIQSSKLDSAYEIAEQIVAAANEVPGTADARIAQRYDNPILEVEINRERALELDLSVEEVMKNLISATNSSINFQPAFWIDKRKGNHYFLGVQYPEEKLSIDSIKEIPIRGGPQGNIRMKDVVEFKRSEGPAVVFHRNISRVTDVYVNVLPGYDVGTVCKSIEERLEELGAQPDSDERGALYRLGMIEQADIDNGANTKDAWTTMPLSNNEKYKGRTVRMMGEVQTMRDSFTQFSGGLIIAIVLVYLVMVALFQSFVDPMIVILAVPLGFIGVVVALTLTQTHLSIMSFMGIIMMVGIVVEYSIVLVDFANKLVSQGLAPRQAIIEAAKVRLRPILMTSLTTWLALLPMAIGFGGGDANVPLARAIIGGVIGATFLSLLVVPCLYVMLKVPGRKTDESATAAQPV